MGIDARPGGTSTDTAGLTVVVPAYNAGPYLERCLQSLLEQTLDRSRYDVLFVDDGSTDGTGERLDRAALEHPDVIRVEHVENSGWPGRPRNLGTDLSGREYVFYCDADDWLLPYALELMLDRAEADRADIVIARPIGNRRRVPTNVWEGGDRCTNWRESPVVFSNLTCHKLFRRRFLRDRDVRFREGRVRLEDFLFMTAAYLRAERISIIGTRPCYVFERREDGANLTATRATEQEYWDSVEQIIELIVSEVEPGPDQDRALDRVVRFELLGPLSRAPLLAKERAVQENAVALGRRLLETKVPESAVARFDSVTRDKVAAIRRGDPDELLRRIEREEAITMSALVEDVAWDGPRLVVRVGLALERDGEVVRLERAGDALLLPRGSEADDPVDVTQSFERTGVHVHLRSRDRSEDWRVRAEAAAVPDDEGAGRAMAWTATVRIDAHSVAGGEALRDGVWDLLVAVGTCGLRRLARPRAVEGGRPEEPPSDVRDGRRVRPYWTQSGALAVTVRPVDAAALPARSKDAANRVGAAVTRRRRRSWRRGAVALASVFGLNVRHVGPGVVLLSRHTELDVAPLAKGRSWVVSRRRAQTPVPEPGSIAGTLDVRSVGSRGWLVSRRAAGAMADITLENQTMQHLGTRHAAWLLARYDVDLVLDVGANTGQYATQLRRHGYRGRIASFEPVPRFAGAVEKLAATDERWNVHRIALGSSEGTVPIRVQRTFSSLLPASEYGKDRFGTLRDFADKDESVVDVPLRRLESVLDQLLPGVTRLDGRPPRVFLKMDTQGFDLEVFRGLGDRLGDIVGLQSEVALLLIYEGMPRMPEAVATYEAAGFEISGMYPVTTEPDGRVIEYDCLMVRAAAAAPDRA